MRQPLTRAFGDAQVLNEETGPSAPTAGSEVIATGPVVGTLALVGTGLSVRGSNGEGHQAWWSHPGESSSRELFYTPG
jgi:hypothetical protein